MQEHALKDNVALIVVLRACRGPPSSAGADSAQSGLSFAVANSHLLFNPKRGDIKVGYLHIQLSVVVISRRCTTGAVRL